MAGKSKKREPEGEGVKPRRESVKAARARRYAELAGQLGVEVPRTEFGRRLLESRLKVLSSGVELLDWSGISEEVAARRGERGEDEG